MLTVVAYIALFLLGLLIGRMVGRELNAPKPLKHGLDKQLTDALYAVNMHKLTIDPKLVDHVTEWTEGEKYRRNETFGHCDMRKWLKELHRLESEVERCKRANAAHDKVADIIGLPKEQIDLVAVIRILDELREAQANEK